MFSGRERIFSLIFEYYRGKVGVEELRVLVIIIKYVNFRVDFGI